jgi:hypothetical protein
MTGRSDFTAAEWEIVRQAPAYAALSVSAAQRGGFFWEAIAIASTYKDVRGGEAESDLLDAIVAEKPHVGRMHFPSVDDARIHALEYIREATALVEQNGTAADVDASATFIVEVAERVARAYPDVEQPIASAERKTLAEIAAAVRLERRA